MSETKETLNTYKDGDLVWVLAETNYVDDLSGSSEEVHQLGLDVEGNSFAFNLTEKTKTKIFSADALHRMLQDYNRLLTLERELKEFDKEMGGDGQIDE